MKPADLNVASVVDVLTFEAHWDGRPAGGKSGQIRDRFGVGAIRYYQHLARHLTTKEALEHDPALTKRLLDLHERRTTARTTRTFRH